MYSEDRSCPQCGEVIEGRPNKKFCSEVCKGRHFRENNSPAFQVDSPVATPTHSTTPGVSSHRSAYPPQSDRDEDERWEKEEAEVSVLAERKHAAELHEQFCGVVRDFLEAEGKALVARQVSRFLQKVANLTTAYLTHPHIKRLGNLVSNRLKALYDVHDILQEVSQEIESKVLWQSKESSFEITKKWRRALRELLIPD